MLDAVPVSELTSIDADDPVYGRNLNLSFIETASEVVTGLADDEATAATITSVTVLPFVVSRTLIFHPLGRALLLLTYEKSPL